MGRDGGGFESNHGRPGARAELWAAWWACFYVAYMLLVGTFVLAEFIAGAVVAAIAASVAELVRVQDVRLFRPRLRWILRARRLPSSIVRDSVVVLAALWDHISGRRTINGGFRAFRYPVGGDDGRAAAKRALINAAISVTPNTYVVGIDPARELILVHQLVPCERSRAREEIMGRL